MHLLKACRRCFWVGHLRLYTCSGFSTIKAITLDRFGIDASSKGAESTILHFFQSVQDFLSDLKEDLRSIAFRIADHNWDALVAADAHVRVDWDLTEQVRFERVRGFLSATFSEEGLRGSVRGFEEAHVFRNTKDWNIDLFEHAGAAACDIRGCGLWCGDDQGTVQRDRLYQ